MKAMKFRIRPHRIDTYNIDGVFTRMDGYALYRLHRIGGAEFISSKQTIAELMEDARIVVDYYDFEVKP